MKYPWIDDYLLSKRSVTKDFQPAWNWVRYHIGGKMFCSHPARYEQRTLLY